MKELNKESKQEMNVLNQETGEKLMHVKQELEKAMLAHHVASVKLTDAAIPKAVREAVSTDRERRL